MPRRPLRKSTVNLVPRAVASAEYLEETTGDNLTDTVNRALQIYAYITKMEQEGRLIFVEHPASGTRERLVLL
jgi:hypothetical protein